MDDAEACAFGAGPGIMGGIAGGEVGAEEEVGLKGGIGAGGETGCAMATGTPNDSGANSGVMEGVNEDSDSALGIAGTVIGCCAASGAISSLATGMGPSFWDAASGTDSEDAALSLP